MKEKNALQYLLFANIILTGFIYFIYRPNYWPFGSEASGCLVSFIVLSVTFILFLKLNDRFEDDNQKRSIKFGLYLGLMWTVEISINNFIRPELPSRDIIDNLFWIIIGLAILVISVINTIQSGKVLSGIKSGFCSGFASGAVACFTALAIIVFGMHSILLDPLNLKEWYDNKSSTYTSSMSVYFAYQTLAGAIMHLYILGIVMGLVLGTIGGTIGWVIVKTKRK